MPTGCLEWQESRFRDGYASIHYKGKRTVVHRLVATLVYGPPEPKMYALHSCDNKSCINPKHLRWGTAKENTQEAFERGLMVGRSGFASSQSVVDREMMLQIFKLRAEGLSYKKIGNAVGVNYNTAWRICRGIGYKNDTKGLLESLTDNDFQLE
jgi:hypothetical protein